MSRTQFSRRDVLLSMTAAGLGTAGAGAAGRVPSAPRPVPSAKQQGDPLNVILIVLDTARRDRFTPYGYARNTTPFLENFANRALVFENAYSTSNWTPPAHGSLFTGVYPSWHGAMSQTSVALSEEYPTVMEVLNQVNYQTVSFSANLMVSTERCARGFREEYLLPELYPFSPIDSRASVGYPSALSWIATKRDPDRPFFLFVNNLEPHDRYDTLDYPYLSRFLDSGVNLGKLREDWAKRHVLDERDRNARFSEPYTEKDLEYISDFYDANIAYLDRWLAKFFGYLKNNFGRIMDRTVVLIASDHGELLGEHGLVTHHGGMYQELCHIPLFMQVPGGALPVGRRTEPVSLVDFPSTLAELLGISWDARANLQGLPWTEKITQERLIYMEDGRVPVRSGFKPATMEYNHMSAIIDGAYKYVWLDTGARSLYCLTDDPAEQSDLVAEKPDLAEKLHGKMAAFFQSAPFGAGNLQQQSQTEEDRQALEALGYL